MKKILIVFSVIISLGLVSCNHIDEEINLAEDKIAIEDLLENYIVANETQNFVLIESIWSEKDDIILYGTDTHERLMGWENIRDAIKNQFSNIEDTYVSASDQLININETANTAWFAETLNYNFMYHGEAKKYEGLRFTGVVEKIDGNWKLVQVHLSVPAMIGISKN